VRVKNGRQTNGHSGLSMAFLIRGMCEVK